MRLRSAAVTAGLALGLASGTANAAFIINFDQTGPDVTVQGSGSFDLTDLTESNAGSADPFIVPKFAAIFLGNTQNVVGYKGFTGPTNFGTGSATSASSGSGPSVGIYVFFVDSILVPDGYQSGQQLTSSATFDNADFRTLGLNYGRYTYTWGSGQHADSLTINVGLVPLPSSAPMFGTAFMALGAVGYAAKRKKAAAG